MEPGKPRIAILGAGPIGLEAALAAAECGLAFTLYEADPEVGGHVRRWGHVRTFTPWEMNVSDRAGRALAESELEAPRGPELPIGHELVERLLEPLASLPALAERLRLGARVVAVGRQGLLKHEEIGSEGRARRPFRLLVADRDGEERVELADVVIDCTGTYGNPNRLGDGGIPAAGEAAFEDRIVRSLPDVTREAPEWAGRTILLTGAGHSAQTAARELAAFARGAPGTRVPQALLAPQALNALAVDLPAVPAELVMRAPVAPARPLPRDPAQLGAQRAVVAARGLMALGRAVLAGDPARPALADAEAVAEHRDRLAPAGRAQKFPPAISFNPSMSSAWPATIRFKRWFSRSSSFRRLASSAFIPPYWLRQR